METKIIKYPKIPEEFGVKLTDLIMAYLDAIHSKPNNYETQKQNILSFFSTSIQQAIAEDRERVENILDKYYAYRQEDGSYTDDPQGNQLIDTIRADLLSSLDTNPNKDI